MPSKSLMNFFLFLDSCLKVSAMEKYVEKVYVNSNLPNFDWFLNMSHAKNIACLLVVR